MNNPLVSIIVRTKDRPELLKRALSSIIAQTYRPIEVVLVNDGGCDLNIEKTKDILGDVSLNYIKLERNTGRAHAGNVGIDNAKGEYIGFLDDDDEYHHHHVETLVRFMEEKKCKVAYTATEFIEKTMDKDNLNEFNIRKHIFAKEFSYNDLLISNYIPLISLLIDSALVKDLKFDESFDLYEDWDMLIRAGETTEFCFINKVTAIYNQWSNSQIAFQSSPEVIRQATLKLYRKHHAKLPVDFIYDLREESARKDIIIAEKNEYIQKMEERINELEKAVKEKDYNSQYLQSKIGRRFLDKYYKTKKWILRQLL